MRIASTCICQRSRRSHYRLIAVERAREITLLNGDYLPLSLSPPPSGCNPCVMDIYEKDMETWLKLKSMSKEEREEIWKGKQSKHETNETALSPEKYNKLKEIDATWKFRELYLYIPVGLSWCRLYKFPKIRLFIPSSYPGIKYWVSELDNTEL